MSVCCTSAKRELRTARDDPSCLLAGWKGLVCSRMVRAPESLEKEQQQPAQVLTECAGAGGEWLEAPCTAGCVAKCVAQAKAMILFDM